jgi:hypothetical protein
MIKFTEKPVRILLLVFVISLIACGQNRDTADNKDPYRIESPEKQPENEESSPVGFSDITGDWELKYGTDYGYRFIFYKNFKALIILYLKNSSIVFKGVYTIEDLNKVRVNIFEMKYADSLKGISSGSGFSKTKMSYFIFSINIKAKDGKRLLFIKPDKIVIDGKSSDGYFEPSIKLKLKKKF